MPEVLIRLAGRLDAQDRAHLLEDPSWVPSQAEVVSRSDGSSVSLEVIDGLLTDFERRVADGNWRDDSASSDRWLAPRVHWALRLTRSEAAERSTWLWLALRFQHYVHWRWDGVKGVTEDRWNGAVNKQAIARLWWGAELFRDGSDYRPVERAFIWQDLTNSVLHRPFVRCRSLALATVDLVAPEGDEQRGSADDVNDLARTLNLGTAGAPPEIEIGFVQDDLIGYLGWARTQAGVPSSWDLLPTGPDCTDTTNESRAGADAIVDRCNGWARDYAQARGTRSARRRNSSASENGTPAPRRAISYPIGLTPEEEGVLW